MGKKKGPPLTLEQRKRLWAKEDQELENYCRWPDEETERLIIMPVPPDPWQVALREARGDSRKRRRARNIE